MSLFLSIPLPPLPSFTLSFRRLVFHCALLQDLLEFVTSSPGMSRTFPLQNKAGKGDVTLAFTSAPSFSPEALAYRVYSSLDPQGRNQVGKIDVVEAAEQALLEGGSPFTTVLWDPRLPSAPRTRGALRMLAKPRYWKEDLLCDWPTEQEEIVTIEEFIE